MIKNKCILPNFEQAQKALVLTRHIKCLIHWQNIYVPIGMVVICYRIDQGNNLWILPRWVGIKLEFQVKGTPKK